MEDIKVTSTVDLKTYFNISLLVYYRLRTILIMIAVIILVSWSLMSSSSFIWWEEPLMIFVIILIYGGLIPLRIYYACRKNMKKFAYLQETQYYTINADEIEYKGDSVSSTSNWQYVVKLVEREKYLLIITSNRSFHYLPKAGFESPGEIARFKNMVMEKGIKMTYN
jgi:hypothetical protein